MNKGLVFKNEGNSVDIKIYGEIGEQDFWTSLFEDSEEKDEAIVHTLEDLDKRLKENQNVATIDIYINSNGGSVFDGVAIYNMLKRHKAYKRVFIDGFACSIASVIAMCGNSITMPKTSMMMIHNAWTVAMGNSKELRKVADDLDKINETIKNAYRSKMKIDDELLNNLMDNESYLTADECYEYGLCTRIDESIDVEKEVEDGLEKMANLYQNKLESLKALKNAIRDIEAEEEPEVKEEEAEVVEIEEVIEATEVEATEVIESEEIIEGETEVSKEVQNIKENALKRFFNLKEDI